MNNVVNLDLLQILSLLMSSRKILNLLLDGQQEKYRKVAYFSTDGGIKSVVRESKLLRVELAHLSDTQSLYCALVSCILLATISDPGSKLHTMSLGL